MGGKCASNRISTTLPRTETTAPRFEGLGLFSMIALHFSFRRVGDSSRQQEIRQVKAGHANPIVGHSVVACALASMQPWLGRPSPMAMTTGHLAKRAPI